MANAYQLNYTPEPEDYPEQPASKELAHDLVGAANATAGIDSQAALRGLSKAATADYAADLTAAFLKESAVENPRDDPRSQELALLTAQTVLNQYRTGWTPETAASAATPSEPTSFEAAAERGIAACLLLDDAHRLQAFLKSAAYYGIEHDLGWKEPPYDPEYQLVIEISQKYNIGGRPTTPTRN